MSYLDQANDPRRSAAALATVGAVHAVLAVGLITGLSVHFATNTERRLIGTNIPLPPPPKPEPVPSPTTQIEVAKVPPAPMPPIDLTQNEPIERVEVIDDPTTVVRVPDPPRIEAKPAPAPSPSFTPKRPNPISPGRWIGDSDYPRRALVDGAEGSVGYRLVIGTNGRVSSCEVIRPAGHRALDDATCRLLASRARFEPATDENGAKVLGTYAGSVTWKLPD